MNENCLIGIVGRSPARTGNQPLLPALTEQYCPMPLLTLSAVGGSGIAKGRRLQGFYAEGKSLTGLGFSI
jgi:hypothetical protein